MTRPPATQLATPLQSALAAQPGRPERRRPGEAACPANPAGHLPPRYGEVLLNQIDRLEASALFTESCSSAAPDLLDHLQTWVDKGAQCVARRLIAIV